VVARQRTRTIAELLGFDASDQTRLATAVSEIARNAVQHGGGGRVAFEIEGRTAPQILSIIVTDRGPGLAHVEELLVGATRTGSGHGMGIVGARRLVDQLSVENRPSGGVRVALTKVFPRAAPLLRPESVPALAQAAVLQAPDSPLDELRRQNGELLRALAALRERQDELERVNGELEDTNRGVIALFAELDEKADHLRRADEMKTRFLSNMSHEFRTPLNAIRGLSNLLIERLDGELNAEQEKQVRLISRAAQELTELVDDLLDLAKVEAGKTEVRPIEFDVHHLLGALRGMLRPLWLNTAVALVFEEAPDLPRLYTDEGKVSQILRNFLSNALKFTERGEIRVSVRLIENGRRIVFSVADTGIGIAREDQERIFQEFSQIDNPLQNKRARGTGLGLPLSRKLAELLNGHIGVQSEPGRGSTFTLELPTKHEVSAEPPPSPAPSAADDLLPVLTIEDSPETVLLYEKFLQGSPFQVLHASNLQRARHLIARRPIRAVLLDIVLRGEDAWSFLAEFKASPATRDIPVIVITFLDDSRKAYALKADAFAQKPPTRRWLLETLQRLVLRESRKVLIIDDEEAARYLLGRIVSEMGWTVVEAEDGKGGLEAARAERPDAVLLDLDLPDRDGVDVLADLKAMDATLPVVITSSREAHALERPVDGAVGTLPKSLSRAETRARLTELLQGIQDRPGRGPRGAARGEAS
jgi:signal transduction histidine kinase/DNA-binding response OmpR family regulator